MKGVVCSDRATPGRELFSPGLISGPRLTVDFYMYIYIDMYIYVYI